MSLFRICILISAVCFSVEAAVQVDFSHSYVGAAAPSQNTGDITLLFNVDGAGDVTLNASCSDSDPAAYVNEFSGAVGSISNSALWGGSFSIILSGSGLRIDNSGSGLAIQGQNAQLIDAVSESINAAFDLSSGKLVLSEIAYANATTSAGTLLDVGGASYPLSGTGGTLSVSVDGPFSITSASDLDNQGFVLSGVSFDIIFTANDTMELGTDLTDEIEVVMDGSSDTFTFAGSSNGTLVVGSAATILTRPDAGGTSPIELGTAELQLDVGSQWILDGSNYSNAYTLGDRFLLATYGSFSGGVLGVRYRNFDLPTDRDLQLTATSTSLYYEVVAQTPATGPNMIIINVDDMIGGEHFGFEGRDCLTPILDSLAASGIHCTEAFAASTVCGPSRYALMSGRWASRNTSLNFISKYPLGTVGRFGVSDTELEDDGENLGTWLQRAGYRTGFVGKAHLIDDPLNNSANWPSAGMVTYASDADPAVDAEVNGAMRHNHRVLAQRMRPYGFDYVSGFYRANLKELVNDFLNVHNQEWITKNALDFIEENHSQRFFLYMAPTINHGPVRNDLSKSLLADSRYTSAGYFSDMDYSFMPSRQSIVDEVTGAGKDLISARESWIDYSIAAIINTLKLHGIENDTLIIFTADHGEKTLTSSPFAWGKSSLFDSGMRVPMVLNWPNGIVSPGRVYSEPVSHIDFVPTLLELAGASDLPIRKIDGVSLVPVLNGGSEALRDEVFCEIGYARGVRTKDWKYIAVRYTPSVYARIESGYLWKNYKTGLYTEPRPYYVNNSSLGYLTQNTHPGYFDDDQMYSLKDDHAEQTNLYGEHPAVAYDMKKRLAAYLEDIPDRPFRQFSDASDEFSPAPISAPTAPGNVQLQFLGTDRVQLDWNDNSSSELGFIVEQSTNGAPFEVIEEKPSGEGAASVSLDPTVEDIVLRVSSYNSKGVSASASDIDLLEPESWRYRTFGSITSSNSQWTADADGDGLTTIWEYAFATDPNDDASFNQFRGGVSNAYLQIVVPQDARRSVTILGRASTDLVVWTAGTPSTELFDRTESHLMIRSTKPVSEASQQFLGAEIILP